MKQRIRQFKVKHEDREMEVFIPESDDKSHDDYIEQVEREKTLAELKAQPPRPKVDKAEQIGVIKEMIEYRNRKRKGEGKKYY